MEAMTDSSTTVEDSHVRAKAPSARDIEILNLLDRAITECAGRDIISTVEMTDLLLDIRLYLMTNPEVALTD